MEWKENKKLFIFIGVLSLVIISSFSPGFKNGSGRISMQTAQVPSALPDEALSTNQYFNQDYSFGFTVPLGSKVVGSISDEESESFLVADGSGQSVQINARLLEEDGDLSASDISQSNPSLEIKSIEEIKVGGIKAVSFLATDDGITYYNEVWFIRQKTLFQVSALESSKSVMIHLLQNWVFEKM